MAFDSVWRRYPLQYVYRARYMHHRTAYSYNLKYTIHFKINSYTIEHELNWSTAPRILPILTLFSLLLPMWQCQGPSWCLTARLHYDSGVPKALIVLELVWLSRKIFLPCTNKRGPQPPAGAITISVLC